MRWKARPTKWQSVFGWEARSTEWEPVFAWEPTGVPTDNGYVWVWLERYERRERYKTEFGPVYEYRLRP